jgi:hypothetical protein
LAREGHAFAETDVICALQTFDDVWGQLFPAEQTRIVQLLARRVTVTSEGVGSIYGTTIRILCPEPTRPAAGAEMLFVDAQGSGGAVESAKGLGT